MELTEQYRQNAADAMETARKATDPKVRKQWLNIAGEWTALVRARMTTMGLRASDFGHMEHKKLEPN